jgi:hypothetical protein
MLNSTELNILQSYLTNNPFIQEWVNGENWNAIALFLAFVPNTYDDPDKTRQELMGLMPDDAEAKFYRITKFRIWYADLSEKIVLGTNKTPLIIGLTEINNNVIKQHKKKVIISLNKLNAIEDDFPIIVQNMFRRTKGGNSEVKEAILSLLICLLTDEVFSQELGIIYYPELNIIPRWESLGFSSVPTIDEISSVLS